MAISVVRYEKKYFDLWNEFLAQCRNTHFLFHRSYMEYHQDRFEDFSLLFFYRQKLVALLPANRQGDTLWSHQGLTFGGMLFDYSMHAPLMLRIWEKLPDFLEKHGFKKLIYKALPYIFHSVPSQEDLYALVKEGAVLQKRELSTVIDLQNYKIQKRRRKYLNRLSRENFHIDTSRDFAPFWQILNEQLFKRHHVRPVHSLKEIQLLAERFPQNILQKVCYDQQNKLLAGVVLYLTPQVVHLQYMVASDEGLQRRVLNVLMQHLLNEWQSQKKYLSFGISTEMEGSYLNEGLVNFKESFGGRSIVHDTYELILEQQNSRFLRL